MKRKKDEHNPNICDFCGGCLYQDPYNTDSIHCKVCGRPILTEMEIDDMLFSARKTLESIEDRYKNYLAGEPDEHLGFIEWLFVHEYLKIQPELL